MNNERDIKNKNRYRLIIFDLGKVLVDFDQDQIAKRLMAKSNKSFPEILNYYSRSNIFHDFECGKLTPEQALQSVNSMLGAHIAMDEFKTLWSDIFSEMPEMHKVVDELRLRHRLFLLSDTNVLHYEFILARFPILKKLDEHILSFKVGVRKPHPLMYETALVRAGARPEESIFIDDKEKNVKGAQALGITAMQHRNVEETKENLKRLGVLT